MEEVLVASKQFIVRPMKEEDCEEVANMIGELAHFQRMNDLWKQTGADIRANTFSVPEPFHRCFVAEEADTAILIAYCIVFPVASISTGRRLHVEDIFIRPHYRGCRIASAFFRVISEFAVQNRIYAMDLSCLQWNSRAALMYEQFGFVNVTESLRCEYWSVGREDLLPIIDCTNNQH